jgi:hypothetical protein
VNADARGFAARVVAALGERGWAGAVLDGLLSQNLLRFLREALPA